MARLCLLDSLGNMLASSVAPEALRIGELSAPLPSGTATIVGWDRRVASLAAAFHNAVHLDLLEAQDGDRRAGLHPSEGAVPASLAVGEGKGSTLGEVIEAMVAGYEVAVRFGAALFPEQTREGFYPDGTCGSLGAAASAARLLNSDASAMSRALAAAASAVPLSLVQNMRSPAKPLIAGLGAELGIRAAVWANAGLGGDLGTFDGPHRFFGKLSSTPHPERLTSGLGRGFVVQDVYLKPYPGGRHAHAAIDAVRKLIPRRGIDPASVRGVEVRTYGPAVALTGSCPTANSPLAEATQSTPYLVAATLVDGRLEYEQVSEARRRDPVILSLARRVRLVEEPAFTRSYPRTTTARVTIELTDGRSLSQTVRHRWGDPERPMSLAAVRVKFLRSLRGRATREEGRRLAERILRADPADPIADLTGAISAVVAAPRASSRPD